MGMNCKSGNCWSKCVMVGLLATVGVAVLGWVVMSLWNWLMPALFGGKEIGYLQAMGILLLSKILFGNWGKRHCPAHRLYRWHSMTPEEREKFREGMRAGCCGSSQGEGGCK